MKVYTGFGYYKPTKTAIIEICLPVPATLPADEYEFTVKNISTTSYNGLVVFVKKKTDNLLSLSGYTLNHVNITVSLAAISTYSGTNGTAEGFNLSESMVLIVHHEANKLVYDDICGQLFQNLNTIATTGVITLTAPLTAAGPSKTGYGTIKKT